MRATKQPVTVRLVASGISVAISCTDQHIAISTSIAAEVFEPGQVAIAADRLSALASRFPPAAEVTVAVDGMATIVSGHSRVRLSVTD
jgi:hypothetical protein